MRRITMVVGLVFGLIVTAGLGAVSCEGGGDDGVCMADYYGGMQCYDCWSKELCEEGSSRTWIEGISSCPEAGYSDYFGNECGYYQ